MSLVSTMGTNCDCAGENQVFLIFFFFFFLKMSFQQNVQVLKEKNIMQNTKLHYLKQMIFYLHLANLILA